MSGANKHRQRSHKTHKQKQENLKWFFGMTQFKTYSKQIFSRKRLF